LKKKEPPKRRDRNTAEVKEQKSKRPVWDGKARRKKEEMRKLSNEIGRVIQPSKFDGRRREGGRTSFVPCHGSGAPP